MAGQSGVVVRVSWSFLVGLWLSVAWISSAAAQSSSEKVAHAHFEAGLRYAAAGELEAAAREFELAYKTRPEYPVLYNLGQAYALMGRPVAAADALSRYLSEGGRAIDPKRRREVETAIDRHRKRIGSLELNVEPKAARGAVDGVALSRIDGSVPLAVGRHALVVTADGYAPHVETILIQPGETTKVSVRLTGAEPGGFARLTVSCPVPDVAVHVDGVERGRTPLDGPLVVKAGHRRVSFVRPGYELNLRSVVAKSGAGTSLHCRLHARKNLGTLESRLRVSVSEPGARVLVDGAALGPGRLPYGLHDVEVRKAGFLPWMRRVNLPSGRVTDLEVRLSLEPELVTERTRQGQNQKFAGYVLAGGGAALGVTAAVLAVIGAREHEQWLRERDLLQQAAASGSAERVREQSAKVHSQALVVQRLDDFALSSAVAGVVLLGLGAGAIVSAPSAPQYDGPAPQISSHSISAVWKRAW